MKVGNGARIYQGVTIGMGRGGYPTLGEGVTVLPNSVVVGGISLGDRSRVAAGAFVDADVPPGATVGRVQGGRGLA